MAYGSDRSCCVIFGLDFFCLSQCNCGYLANFAGACCVACSFSSESQAVGSSFATKAFASMKQNKTLSLQKYRILVGLLVFVFSLLSLRLIDLQLVRGQEFFELSEDNKSFQEITARRRGVFLDRYGEAIAFNAPTYFLRDATKLFASATRISAPEALAFATTATGSSELVIGMERSYPYGTSFAHTLGYTSSVSVEDLQAEPDLLPSDSIGKFGLEKSFEKRVRGKTGVTRYTINAQGRRLAVEQSIVGESGQTIKTSLDPYLSSMATEIMGDLEGSVIISDPKTGQILTLISSPSFDPNLFSKTGLDAKAEKERREAVRSIVSHPKNLFFNRAIAGAYPPGSVFKLVTAVAGIETGAITATTTVEDTGVLSVNDFDFANWYYSQYGRTEGTLSLQRALARSNDIYFYKAAEAIGPDRLAEFARLFGYGERTKVELSGEAAGLVPDPKWKEQQLGERWFLGNTYHFGIGQGLLLVTPLQVSQMTASIANKGVHCPPTVLQTNQQCEGLGVRQATLDLVLDGMLDACSSGGTAFPLFAYNQTHRQPELGGFEAVKLGAIACKTGTAEFGGNTENGHKKTHAWFTAVVGTKSIRAALETAVATATDSAEVTLHTKWQAQVQAHGLPDTLAFTVLVESDEVEPFREGSRDAAPVVAKLLEWMEAGTGEGDK
ncbi:MAG: hypothetical protein COU67_03480 [Candidatus Pacebacteria bacterium CG10_big_fil_rev_8_21_14_0_10_44_54]|nr:MAG: hypothetical protein COU67_03480 [Candidatus Pacebacteria bacterium CG10_big_fil_rev_8_21_14_0_10_44_54]